MKNVGLGGTYLMPIRSVSERPEYQLWDNHRWGNGLYWQYDVRDAMEETISGGRREKNARPSINSYLKSATYRV